MKWLDIPKDQIAIENEDFVVYPENWPALQLFFKCSTQWRISMNGPTGLDYTSLLSVMSLSGVDEKDRSELFNKIRLIEGGAISAIQKPKK